MLLFEKLGKTKLIVYIKNFVYLILKKFGYVIVSNENFEFFNKHNNAIYDLQMLFSLDKKQVVPYLENFNLSKSQIRQDLFVLSHLNFKKNGFFIDVGATDGIFLSNTYLLEKYFDWEGILVEPAAGWHEQLNINRLNPIEKSAIWSSSNYSLDFFEAESKELSTISKFRRLDIHSRSRKKGISYAVSTITLMDLLHKYNAPKVIDYLSIDTEGSEFEILKNFDFDQYIVNVITCEHNYTDAREKIYRFLVNRGFKRVMPEISQFDDWYVNEKSSTELRS